MTVVTGTECLVELQIERVSIHGYGLRSLPCQIRQLYSFFPPILIIIGTSLSVQSLPSVSFNGMLISQLARIATKDSFRASLVFLDSRDVNSGMTSKSKRLDLCFFGQSFLCLLCIEPLESMYVRYLYIHILKSLMVSFSIYSQLQEPYSYQRWR